MHRKLPLLAVIALSALVPGAIPEARADRLGGNYRGPGDEYRVREDAPAPVDALPKRDPLLDAFGLDARFVVGSDAGFREARFRGRPVLLFLALRGCAASESVAEKALRDAEVQALASRFVPAVADVEKEEMFGVTRRVRTIPTILLFDPEGRETGRAEGAVDAARLAAVLREVLRVSGPVRPTPEAVALERAATDLERARKAKEWRLVLGTAATIERLGHDGPEREAARAAKDEAAREAASLLETARTRFEAGSPIAGRRLLERVAREFEGIGEADEATALLRERERGASGPSGLRGEFRPAPVSNPRPDNPRVSLPEPDLTTDPLPVPEPSPEPDP